MNKNEVQKAAQAMIDRDLPKAEAELQRALERIDAMAQQSFRAADAYAKAHGFSLAINAAPVAYYPTIQSRGRIKFWRAPVSAKQTK